MKAFLQQLINKKMWINNQQKYQFLSLHKRENKNKSIIKHLQMHNIIIRLKNKKLKLKLPPQKQQNKLSISHKLSRKRRHNDLISIFMQ